MADWQYTIQFHAWSASHHTMAETVAFLDRWRGRENGWFTVVRYGHHSTDEGDTGLTELEAECVNEPAGPVRDELVRRIDSERMAA